MNSSEHSVHPNESDADASKKDSAINENCLMLTQERIRRTHECVQHVRDRLRAQQRSLTLLHLQDERLFERCLRQQEAIERQRATLLRGSSQLQTHAEHPGSSLSSS